MRWFVRGDVDGFFGLALDNLVQLLVLTELCRTVLGFPDALIAGRILPGAAVSLLVGNAFYGWQAMRLARATGRTMVSFGQGCEGEPLLRYREIARAIRLMRQRTPRGSINVNTNGSLPKALAALADSGLDAVRISLNSASADLYQAYYQPRGYGLEDVVESMRVARAGGLYLALNLLVFPGVTDREEEARRLCRLVRRVGAHQVQMRSLAIDPDVYWALAKRRGGGGVAIGVRALVRALRQARPGLVVGNFARGLGERGAPP